MVLPDRADVSSTVTRVTHPADDPVAVAGAAPADGVPAYEIVLVTYRSGPLVRALLDELPSSLPIVIVDNGHGIDGLGAIPAGRPATRYLDGPGAGFASGANVGARSSTHDIVIFVNPDSVPTMRQLDSLALDLAGDPTLAGVAAMTVKSDGRVEIGTGGWEPTARRAFVHAIGAHKVFRTSGLWASPVPGQPIELDWLSGACMAVRRETFLEIGGFDERFFVYSEDVAFGRQVREAGMHLRMRTDLLVRHLGGSSGDAKTRMLQFRSDSLIRYVKRHNGLATVLGVRVALTAGYAARYVMCHALRRRGQAIEHAAYIKGLWAGAPLT